MMGVKALCHLSTLFMLIHVKCHRLRCCYIILPFSVKCLEPSARPFLFFLEFFEIVLRGPQKLQVPKEKERFSCKLLEA